jgi:pantetheine-phosphate adenylyltransferase
MALANSALAPQIETVFLMANEKYSHISSTLIRQIARMGKDSSADKLRQFVPEAVIEPLLAKCRG